MRGYTKTKIKTTIRNEVEEILESRKKILKSRIKYFYKNHQKKLIQSGHIVMIKKYTKEELQEMLKKQIVPEILIIYIDKNWNVVINGTIVDSSYQKIIKNFK